MVSEVEIQAKITVEKQSASNQLQIQKRNDCYTKADMLLLEGYIFNLSIIRPHKQLCVHHIIQQTGIHFKSTF